MKKGREKSREKVTVRRVGCSLHEKLREISIRGYYFPQTTSVLGKRRCSRYNSPYPYTALNACVTTCEDSFSKTSVDFIVLFDSPALLTALFSFAVSPMSIFFPPLCWKWNEAEREDVGQTSMKRRQGPLRSVRVCSCHFASVFCAGDVHVRDRTNIFLSRLVDMYMQKDAVNISMCILMFIFTRNNKVVNSFWNLNPFFLPNTHAYTPACLHLRSATLISGATALSTSLYGRRVVTKAGPKRTNVMRNRTKWLWQAKKQAHIHSFNSALTFCNCWTNQAQARVVFILKCKDFWNTM